MVPSSVQGDFFPKLQPREKGFSIIQVEHGIEKTGGWIW